MSSTLTGSTIKEYIVITSTRNIWIDITRFFEERMTLPEAVSLVKELISPEETDGWKCLNYYQAFDPYHWGRGTNHRASITLTKTTIEQSDIDAREDWENAQRDMLSKAAQSIAVNIDRHIISGVWNESWLE